MSVMRYLATFYILGFYQRESEQPRVVIQSGGKYSRQAELSKYEGPALRSALPFVFASIFSLRLVQRVLNGSNTFYWKQYQFISMTRACSFWGLQGRDDHPRSLALLRFPRSVARKKETYHFVALELARRSVRGILG